jgi:uncharacterized protein YjiS (DUF1127 family)
MRTHRDTDAALAAGPLTPARSRPAVIRAEAARLQRIGEAIGSAVAYAVQWLSWRRHVSALQRLDDATLKDIGLVRTCIESYVAEHHAIASGRPARRGEDPWIKVV